MAITYQSLQSATVANSSLVITKPTGLAVGDTMLAGILFSDDNSGGGGINTPSGWTLIQTQTDGNTPTHTVTALFSKEADSSDVAASNFTFTRSGSDTDYHMIGHLLRISEYGLNAGSVKNHDGNSGTTVTVAGFTPTHTDTLFVSFLSHTSVTGSGITNTSVALTTDNPTWTERAESSVTDASRGSVLSVYTATRSAATATGTITGTFSAAAIAKHIHVISISSKLSGSVNPTTYVNAYAFNNYNPSVGLDGIVDLPDLSTTGARFTNWTNTTKPSTTWTNTPKI